MAVVFSLLHEDCSVLARVESRSRGSDAMFTSGGTLLSSIRILSSGSFGSMIGCLRSQMNLAYCWYEPRLLDLSTLITDNTTWRCWWRQCLAHPPFITTSASVGDFLLWYFTSTRALRFGLVTGFLLKFKMTLPNFCTFYQFNLLSRQRSVCITSLVVWVLTLWCCESTEWFKLGCVLTGVLYAHLPCCVDFATLLDQLLVAILFKIRTDTLKMDEFQWPSWKEMHFPFHNLMCDISFVV